MTVDILAAPLRRQFAALFARPDAAGRPLTRVWLIGLYGLGLFMWGRVFSWGAAPLDFHDWVEITVPRLHMMQQAYLSGVFPFHVSDAAAMHDISDRFLVLPDVITTPQTLLLLFLDLRTFVLVDVLINYTIGALGLLWLRRELGLSLASFTALFLLFNLNGFIVSHYSVGHLTWGGYFLYPVMIGLLIRLVKGRADWRWVAAFSVASFYMVLAGSRHHFAWLLLFTLPLGFLPRYAKWTWLAVVSAGLLSAVRLMPPALALGTFLSRPEFNLPIGYPSLAHIVKGMILLAVPAATPVGTFSLQAVGEFLWEYYYFVGLVGFAFIAYFGIWRWHSGDTSWTTPLVFSTCLLIFLSLGSNFRFVELLRVPLFGGQRVTSRLLSVPVTAIMIVAAARFQEWLDAEAGGRWQAIAFGSIAAGGFLFSDLWANVKVWRVQVRASYFPPLGHVLPAQPIVNHADPTYFTVLGIGLAITVVTAMFLTVMCWRESRSHA